MSQREISTTHMTHPDFLKAQRCALTLWGNGAKELIDATPEGQPIPGVVLTTSSAREDFLEKYVEQNYPEIHEAQCALHHALHVAEDSGVLTEEFERSVFSALNALEEQVTVDPLVDSKALWPVHSCHTSAISSVVLARLQNPTDPLLILTNEYHTTIKLKDGSYWDPLVAEGHIERYRELGGGYRELSLGGVPLSGIAEAAMAFVLDVDISAYKTQNQTRNQEQGEMRMTIKRDHFQRVQAAIAELEEFAGGSQTLMQKAKFLNKTGPFTVRGKLWSKHCLAKYLQRSEANFGVQPEEETAA